MIISSLNRVFWKKPHGLYDPCTFRIILNSMIIWYPSYIHLTLHVLARALSTLLVQKVDRIRWVSWSIPRSASAYTKIPQVEKIVWFCHRRGIHSELDTREGKGRRWCSGNVIESCKDDLKKSYWKKHPLRVLVWYGVNCMIIHLSESIHSAKSSLFLSSFSSNHPIVLNF